MGIEIREEPLSSMLEEMKILAELHGKEVANPELTSPDIVINPSWGPMLTLASTGLFVSISARLDGDLVGYATFILYVDLHRTRKDGTPLLSAQDDAYYVLPECRGPRVGFRLFIEAEASLAARGVGKVSIHGKYHLGPSRLLRAMGYIPDDVNYVKYLAGPLGLPQVEPR